MRPKVGSHRPGVDLKGRVFAGVALNDAQNLGGDIFGFGPMAFIPFLKLFDLTPQLDVELHVIVEAGVGEVTRPHQGHRTDHVQLSVSDIGFGVELLFPVDAGLYLTGLDGLDDGGHTG